MKEKTKQKPRRNAPSFPALLPLPCSIKWMAESMSRGNGARRLRAVLENGWRKERE